MQRRSHSNDEGWLLSYADLITNLLIFFAMLLAGANMSRSKMQQITERISGVEQPESLSAIQKQIEKEIAAQGLQDVVRTDLTDEGLRLSLNSGLVFDSGRGDIRVGQEVVLDQMLQTLVPYAQRYGFAVEGHTDPEPLNGGGGFASNWELSTARANAVRSRLETVGVEARRIKVEGYADTITLPEEELEGLSPAERNARHRRVVVRVF
jgi:chemotaxis protein MotB